MFLSAAGNTISSNSKGKINMFIELNTQVGYKDAPKGEVNIVKTLRFEDGFCIVTDGVKELRARGGELIRLHDLSDQEYSRLDSIKSRALELSGLVDDKETLSLLKAIAWCCAYESSPTANTPKEGEQPFGNLIVVRPIASLAKNKGDEELIEELALMLEKDDFHAYPMEIGKFIFNRAEVILDMIEAQVKRPREH